MITVIISILADQIGEDTGWAVFWSLILFQVITGDIGK